MLYYAHEHCVILFIKQIYVHVEMICVILLNKIFRYMYKKKNLFLQKWQFLKVMHAKYFDDKKSRLNRSYICIHTCASNNQLDEWMNEWTNDRSIVGMDEWMDKLVLDSRVSVTWHSRNSSHSRLLIHILASTSSTLYI